MESGTVTIQALGQVMTSVGLSATLILFFVWQSWKREERTATEVAAREVQWEAREEKVVARLQIVEDFTRTTLINMNERTLVAMTQNATTSQAQVEAIHAIAADLKIHHEFAVESVKKLIKNT